MSAKRRIRLTERHAVERGVQCPSCGSYTSLADIITTERCRGRRTNGCDATLRVELVVRD